MKQRRAIAWMEQAADSRHPTIMTAGKTEWVGDLWVNHITAKSLARRGIIEIEWPPYEDDDVYLTLKVEQA